MAPKQFTIGFSRTINLGNYESARVEASIVIELNDGDWDTPKIGEAQKVLRYLLEETWKAQNKTINGKQKP